MQRKAGMGDIRNFVTALRISAIFTAKAIVAHYDIFDMALQ